VSFGFRGEALASISYVARITVTSKTEHSELAYSADFSDGIMRNDNGEWPRPTAGQKGTVIQVRDLFHNNDKRKKTAGFNEEYVKVVDVVAKYSIHYPMINFTCKKVSIKLYNNIGGR